jgi:nitrogenase molybdenum-iron protein alpha/beta subunit
MNLKNLPEIMPDGFTGAITAIEGIKDAAVLLNGPTGCKFYHGAVADGQFPRVDSLDPLYYSEEFYFGQPRVPATYLDDHDYVFGATDKLEKILPVVAQKGHSMVAVVNSPGAALIGDDLERFIGQAGLPVPCIAIESAGFSDSFTTGFQRAVIQILELLDPKPAGIEQKSVNLVGLSIFHRHWQGNIDELRYLLKLCGIKVVAALCAGGTVEELQRLGSAKYNLVVHGEFADQITPFLEKRFGQSSIIPEKGAPLGFDATEAWIRKACNAVDADSSPALMMIDAACKQSCEVLSRFNSLTGLPKGTTFAIDTEPSIALPLTKWLYSWLGMVPVSVSAGDSDNDYASELRKFLSDIDCMGAWNMEAAKAAPDVAFGSEFFISRLRLRGLPVIGIDISLPGNGYIDFIQKSLLGARGSLYLLEKIINGLYTLYT